MKSKLLIFVAALSLSACGGSSDTSLNDDPYGINGIWRVQCYEIDPLTFPGVYFEGTLIFQAYSWEGISRFYSDMDCSVPFDNNSSVKGTFKFGNLVTTSSGQDAYEIDLNITTINGIQSPADEAVDVYGLIKLEGDILYLSNGFSQVRANDLNYDAVYYKQ